MLYRHLFSQVMEIDEDLEVSLLALVYPFFNLATTVYCHYANFALHSRYVHGNNIPAYQIIARGPHERKAEG